MRVLHVIHSLDLKSGGPSHALFALVQAQVKLGLEPHIFCTDRQAGATWKPDEEYIADLRAKLPSQIGSLTVLPAKGRTRPWIRYGFSFQCHRSLKAFLGDEQTKPAFVHIHGLFSQITSVAAKLSHQNGIPHAVRPTGALDPLPLSMGNSLLKKVYLNLVMKRMLNSATFIHTTSESEAETAKQFVPSDQVKVVPLGINVPELDPADGAKQFCSQFPQLEGHPFILCVSRIHPKKNLKLAIRAFHRWALKEPSFHLVIAGDKTANEYQQGLEALAVDLGIRSNVHFVGFLEGAVKSGAFFAASCFLQTSHHENFGVSIPESMAHGLKVVSTPGVASSRYLEPANGGEVAKDNPEAVSIAIERVIADGDSSRNKALQSWVESKMSWDHVARSLSHIYQQACSA